ncbi:hypothetical protein B0T17DRAFT_46213 [Bombardia bombarda]|uniref:Uncharacterized protein n=1 Tax=Bombardia bombarda TaxID=252184 RepID=A0AA39XK52_9PEZI|nr:hypothetical protein B0T17DRAFT_46213 [Bombardia bombarda]
MTNRISPACFPRSSNSTAASPMSTGTIVGISFAAAALFICAFCLFFIYWRRQRRLDARDDEFYQAGEDDGQNTAPPPMYTLDHKGSSYYIYSSETAKISKSLSPMSEMASAMPAHPAYIPRAVVRGMGPVAAAPAHTTNTQAWTLSHLQSNKPSVSDGQLMADASDSDDRERIPNYSRSIQRRTDLPLRVEMEAGARAGTGRAPEQQLESCADGNNRNAITSHQAPLLQSPAQLKVDNNVVSISGSSNNHHPSFAARRPIPDLTIPTTLRPSQRPARKYSPPRLNLNLAHGQNSKPPPRIHGAEKPLSGRENMAISGPMAFPPATQPSTRQWQQEEQYQRQQQIYGATNPAEAITAATAATATTADRRTFRDRTFSYFMNRNSLLGSSSSQERSGSAAGAGAGIGVTSRSGRHDSSSDNQQHNRYSGANRHYTEIEIGRGSDIW